MYNPFKKFMKQYISEDPAKDAIKKVKKQSAVVKYATSDDPDRAVDYALSLYKDQHKDDGTTNPYPWM